MPAKLKRISNHPMSQDQATEAYLHCRDKILMMCQKFHTRYGGEFEELVSQAHLHFVTIYIRHVSTRSSLMTHLGFMLWKSLLETRRIEINRENLLVRSSLDEIGDIEEIRPHQFDIDEFADELSEYSGHVVRLVFNTPKPLKKLIRRKMESKTREFKDDGIPTGRNYRVALRSYLRDIGWSINSIVSSFNEIREAL